MRAILRHDFFHWLVAVEDATQDAGLVRALWEPELHPRGALRHKKIDQPLPGFTQLGAAPDESRPAALAALDSLRAAALGA